MSVLIKLDVNCLFAHICNQFSCLGCEKSLASLFGPFFATLMEKWTVVDQQFLQWSSTWQ